MATMGADPAPIWAGSPVFSGKNRLGCSTVSLRMSRICDMVHSPRVEAGDTVLHVQLPPRALTRGCIQNGLCYAGWQAPWEMHTLYSSTHVRGDGRSHRLLTIACGRAMPRTTPSC